jgi:hypothetical protein
VITPSIASSQPSGARGVTIRWDVATLRDVVRKSAALVPCYLRLVRHKPEDRIGERFLSKRPPPTRHAWLILAGLLAVLATVIVLFAVGQWEPGIFGVLMLIASTLWARRTLLP